MLRGVDDPSRHFEVVNAGVSGLDSRQALGRLQSAVAPLEPELVTVYIGWNDLMKLSPTSQTKRGLLSGASRFVDRLWLARGARKALFFHLRPMLGAPRTGPESRTGTFERFSPTYFEANLRKIVDSIRVIGARPVLLTLPTAVFEEARQDDLVRIRAQFPYFWSADAVGGISSTSWRATITQTGERR